MGWVGWDVCDEKFMIKYLIKSKQYHRFEVMKEKQKGGPRTGAGRKPSPNPKEPITVFVETKTVQLYGGKDGIRLAIYGFLKSDDSAGLLPDARKEIKNIKIKDLTKPMSALKPQEQPKTNLSTNTKPKTLDGLKSLCPAELTGLDRAAWISTERQRYGI